MSTEEDGLMKQYNVEALRRALEVWEHAPAGVFNGTHCWACHDTLEDTVSDNREDIQKCNCTFNERAEFISVEFIFGLIEPANAMLPYYSKPPEKSPELLQFQGVKLLMASNEHSDSLLVWAQADGDSEHVFIWGEGIDVVDGIYGHADAKAVVRHYALKYGLVNDFRRDYEHGNWVMRDN